MKKKISIRAIFLTGVFFISLFLFVGNASAKLGERCDNDFDCNLGYTCWSNNCLEYAEKCAELESGSGEKVCVLNINSAICTKSCCTSCCQGKGFTGGACQTGAGPCNCTGSATCDAYCKANGFPLGGSCSSQVNVFACNGANNICDYNRVNVGHQGECNILNCFCVGKSVPCSDCLNRCTFTGCPVACSSRGGACNFNPNLPVPQQDGCCGGLTCPPNQHCCDTRIDIGDGLGPCWCDAECKPGSTCPVVGGTCQAGGPTCASGDGCRAGCVPEDPDCCYSPKTNPHNECVGGVCTPKNTCGVSDCVGTGACGCTAPNYDPHRTCSFISGCVLTAGCGPHECTNTLDCPSNTCDGLGGICCAGTCSSLIVGSTDCADKCCKPTNCSSGGTTCAAKGGECCAGTCSTLIPGSTDCADKCCTPANCIGGTTCAAKGGQCCTGACNTLVPGANLTECPTKCCTVANCTDGGISCAAKGGECCAGTCSTLIPGSTDCADKCCTPANCTGGGTSGGVKISLSNPLHFSSFTELVDNLINFAFTLGIILAPLFYIIAGIYFMTAAGDSQKVTTAKNIILWTTIGLGIILLARGLISVIQSVIGG